MFGGGAIMTDSDKCPEKCICGRDRREWWEDGSALYFCGCVMSGESVTVLCPKSHRIAIERGETIEKREVEIERLEKICIERGREIERLKGEYEKLARRRPACIDCNLPMGDIGLKPKYETFPLKENPEHGEDKDWHWCYDAGAEFRVPSAECVDIPKDQCPKCQEGR